MTFRGPLIDQFGREHTNLRVSVTDRCNIRCFYCMPTRGVEKLPHADILRYEEGWFAEGRHEARLVARRPA